MEEKLILTKESEVYTQYYNDNLKKYCASKSDVMLFTEVVKKWPFEKDASKQLVTAKENMEKLELLLGNLLKLRDEAIKKEAEVKEAAN